MVRLLRPRQWIKNVFVLAPLLFAVKFRDGEAIGEALLAAALFCVASSAVYIVNDWRDVEQDRHHPVKRQTRPLAAGMVSPTAAALLFALCVALLLGGALLAPAVVAVIGVYVVINLAYSFGLRHVPVVDIFTIASGFVLRVYAGAMALRVPVSSWMFVTTLCLALYLAAVKRRQEMLVQGAAAREVLGKYSPALIDRYAEMSATGALVFYSLFVMTAHTELIVTIPLVLFGLFRYWYVVDQTGGGESPTDVVWTDLPLQLTVVGWLALCTWRLWA